MRKHPLFTTLVAFALGLAVTLTGCSAPADTGAEASREASLVKQTEACFTNELANEPVTLKTIRDGSGVQWEGTVRPGATACTRTKGESGSDGLFGLISHVGDSSLNTFRFVNPPVGYPSGSIVIGAREGGEEGGPGMCQGFAALETGVLDSGATRFTVRRLIDSDTKRLKVRIQPTQAKQIPNQGCYYQQSEVNW